MYYEDESVTVTDVQLNQIRASLMDYYGAASFAASPFARADLVRVESMNPQELVDEALRLGIIHIQRQG